MQIFTRRVDKAEAMEVRDRYAREIKCSHHDMNSCIFSSDERFSLELKYEGESRFGPRHFSAFVRTRGGAIIKKIKKKAIGIPGSVGRGCHYWYGNAWSPDLRYMCLVELGNAGDPQVELVLYDTDRWRRTVVDSSRSLFAHVWSPKSTHLVYLCNVPNTREYDWKEYDLSAMKSVSFARSVEATTHCSYDSGGALLVLLNEREATFSVIDAKSLDQLATDRQEDFFSNDVKNRCSIYSPWNDTLYVADNPLGNGQQKEGEWIGARIVTDQIDTAKPSRIKPV